MHTFNYDTVEAFVKRQQRLKNDVRWDNYTLVFFNSDDAAHRRVNGVFRKGRYGYETRIDPNEQGLWNVKATLTRGMGRVRG